MKPRKYNVTNFQDGHHVLMLRWIFMVFLSISSLAVFSQSANRLTKEGNQLYNEKKYNDAEVKYRKSIAAEKDNKAAQYNLGNAFYQEKNFESATKQYEQVLQRKDLSQEQKANAFHNMGNSLLQEKKYEESIKAFKESLKLDPKDNDTRYNLAYAQSMLQKQQQQQQQQQNKQDQKKNQNQQQQQQQGKDKKEQQQQQDENSASTDKSKNDKEKGKLEKQGISKEDAEKMLQSLNNDEKNLQKKLNKKEGSRQSIEKNW